MNCNGRSLTIDLLLHLFQLFEHDPVMEVGAGPLTQVRSIALEFGRELVGW